MNEKGAITSLVFYISCDYFIGKATNIYKLCIDSGKDLRIKPSNILTMEKRMQLYDIDEIVDILKKCDAVIQFDFHCSFRGDSLCIKSGSLLAEFLAAKALEKPVYQFYDNNKVIIDRLEKRILSDKFDLSMSNEEKVRKIKEAYTQLISLIQKKDDILQGKR